METKILRHSSLIEAVKKNTPANYGVFVRLGNEDDNGRIISNPHEIEEYFKDAKEENIGELEVAKMIIEAVIEQERYLHEEVLAPIFKALHEDLAQIWARQDELEKLIKS